MTGTPASADRETWNHELAEVTALALAAEQLPAAVPLLISNTLAAVSAYTEAVTDGVQHELRRALFEAIWVRRRHLSSAYDVRPIITSVTAHHRVVATRGAGTLICSSAPSARYLAGRCGCTAHFRVVA
jgi:hypothetical protein